MKITEISEIVDTHPSNPDFMVNMIEFELDSIAQDSVGYYKYSEESPEQVETVYEVINQLSEDEFYQLIESDIIQYEAQDNYDGADGGDTHLSASVILNAIAQLKGER